MSKVNNHTVIVGAGFAGIGMAIRLKQAGFHDFTIFERASEVGGTWRDNHYPGAACDVPSHVYSYSFEPNPQWSKMFSPQEEILAYLKHCADKYQIRPHIQFNTSVTSSTFDQETGLWSLETEAGTAVQARFFILCSGGFSRPALPDIPGLDSFQGDILHSARWNHDVELKDRRVAVIGTGASGIQIVPAIADKVSRLKLFQRTAAWIMPKPERNFGKWERTLFAKIPGYQWLMRKLLYWQFELRAIGLLKPFIMQWGQKKALAYLQSQITDPDLQTKLTPNYTMGCKRILLSNDFYAAVSREHVDLVTSPINQVSAKGLITEDGQEHEVDAIICATGFQVAEAAAPFPIYGPNQWQLADAWQAGAEAYLGTAVHGFPNFFIIVGPNSGLGHNSIVFIIESQVQYILDAIRKVRAKGIKSVEVKADVQQNYNRELAERFKDTVWTTGNCQSWYHTASGKNTTLWPGFSFELRWRTRRFNLAEYRQLDQSKPGTIPATSKRLEPTRQIS